jgi:hypothetical protein
VLERLSFGKSSLPRTMANQGRCVGHKGAGGGASGAVVRMLAWAMLGTSQRATAAPLPGITTLLICVRGTLFGAKHRFKAPISNSACESGCRATATAFFCFDGHNHGTGFAHNPGKMPAVMCTHQFSQIHVLIPSSGTGPARPWPSLSLSTAGSCWCITGLATASWLASSPGECLPLLLHCAVPATPCSVASAAHQAVAPNHRPIIAPAPMLQVPAAGGTPCIACITCLARTLFCFVTCIPPCEGDVAAGLLFPRQADGALQGG